MECLYNVLLDIDRYQLAERPDTEATTILNTVLQEINKHKIGVPSSTAHKLKDQMANKEMKVNFLYYRTFPLLSLLFILSTLNRI